jgi:hypothetical protein
MAARSVLGPAAPEPHEGTGKVRQNPPKPLKVHARDSLAPILL